MEGRTFYETALDAAQDPIDEVEEEEVVEEEPLEIETQSILEVGHLKGSTKIGDHVITFRTLTIGEELEAAQLAQPYKDTIEEPRALMAALISAAIITVDGGSLLGVTLGNFQETAEARFDQVLKWHWPVISSIYTEFAKATDEVYRQYNEVKKD